MARTYDRKRWKPTSSGQQWQSPLRVVLLSARRPHFPERQHFAHPNTLTHKSHQVLGIPEDYLVGIVPASDTGVPPLEPSTFPFARSLCAMFSTPSE